MKRTLSLIICMMSQVSSFGQITDGYKFDILTKFGSQIKIEVGITYKGITKAQEKDSSVNFINKVLVDSLQQFDLIQMYYGKRLDMQNIIYRVFKREFRKLNLNVESAILRDINFPKEAKILINRFSDLEMNYYNVLLIIDNRTKEIEEILQTHQDLSEIEVSELKRELYVLEHHEYVRKIYDEQILDLLKQGLSNTNAQ